tara:strand:+ start:74 stop:1105 length:1032 start_codon:yes stop_codon:yes gene_type:complete
MIKIVLMGCGRIAKKHSEILGGGHIKGAKLTGVCDVDVLKAKELAKKYNVPYFQNIREALQNVECDVVSILTPSGLHGENIIQVANYNKHIIVEKPMTLTEKDAEQVIDECEKKNIKLFVVKQNRFNLPIIKLKEAIESQKFGKLILATIRVRWARHQKYYDMDKWRGTFKLDGGVLSNQASHHLDLLEWMMGDIDSVYAKSMTALAEIETEDTAVAILKFKNGGLGIIEATTAARPNNIEGSISILGEKGTVVVGGIAVDKVISWRFEGEEEKEDDIIKNFSKEVDHVYGEGHKLYYDHVINVLKNHKSFMIDGNEGKKSVRLINAIYESVKRNKEVKINNS